MINFDIIEKIREAHRLAEIEQIKANAIVINKNFVKIPKLVVDGGGCVSVLPPMICGLEMHFTDNELPENYAFAITEACQTERDRLVEETKFKTAKEILCELLDIEVKDEDYKMFFLDVCEKLEKFAQKYGVEVE